MIGSKKFSWLAVLALTGMVSASQAVTPDETAIRNQTLAWEKAYNAGDAKGVIALYADDALLLPPGAPAARGTAAITMYFNKDVAGSKAADVVLVIDPNTDVGVSGDMGWESGTYKVTLKGAVVETGKSLSVSRKTDGKWLYIHDAWNSDATPAPAPEPAKPTGAPLKAPEAKK